MGGTLAIAGLFVWTEKKWGSQAGLGKLGCRLRVRGTRPSPMNWLMQTCGKDPTDWAGGIGCGLRQQQGPASRKACRRWCRQGCRPVVKKAENK
ncbi:hypothetical protein EV2_008962 [Malus domestica]